MAPSQFSNSLTMLWIRYLECGRLVIRRDMGDTIGAEALSCTMNVSRSSIDPPTTGAGPPFTRAQLETHLRARGRRPNRDEST
jgi:hypothetical protein